MINHFKHKPEMTAKHCQKNKSGFSLLELSAVMFLIITLLGFALPRFSLILESDLEKTIHKVAYILNDLKVQAVLRGENYKVVFDTSKSEYSVLTQDFSNLEFYPHEKYSRPIPLEEPVKFHKVAKDKEKEEYHKLGFEDIEFQELFGQKHEFRVSSSGLIDLFTIKLKDETHYLSLSVVNVMGKIVIGEKLTL